MRYEKEGTRYLLIDGDDVLVEMDQVGICYDRWEGTLLKHGEPEAVRMWHEKQCARLVAKGFHTMAADTVLVSGAFDVEDLNKIIDVAGYVAQWAKEQGFPAGPRKRHRDRTDETGLGIA